MDLWRCSSSAGSWRLENPLPTMQRCSLWTAPPRRTTSSTTPKAAPKARNLSRASTPSRATSIGSRTNKGNDQGSETPILPVVQALRLSARKKDKSPKTPDKVSTPSSSRSSSSRRSRSSTKVRDKSQATAERRILSAETEEHPTPLAIGDTSPIQFPSPTGDRGESAQMSIRDQLY